MVYTDSTRCTAPPINSCNPQTEHHLPGHRKTGPTGSLNALTCLYYFVIVAQYNNNAKEEKNQQYKAKYLYAAETFSRNWYYSLSVKKLTIFLRKPKLYHYVHKKPSPVSILSQVNPIRAFLPCCSKVNFNIILRSPKFSDSYFSSGFTFSIL
jgi:hypothetical protein